MSPPSRASPHLAHARERLRCRLADLSPQARCNLGGSRKPLGQSSEWPPCTFIPFVFASLEFMKNFPLPSNASPCNARLAEPTEKVAPERSREGTKQAGLKGGATPNDSMRLTGRANARRLFSPQPSASLKLKPFGFGTSCVGCGDWLVGRQTTRTVGSGRAPSWPSESSLPGVLRAATAASGARGQERRASLGQSIPPPRAWLAPPTNLA